MGDAGPRRLKWGRGRPQETRSSKRVIITKFVALDQIVRAQVGDKKLEGCWELALETGGVTDPLESPLSPHVIVPHFVAVRQTVWT